MQERSFGKIKFPWELNFKQTGEWKTLTDKNEKLLREFAKGMIHGIPEYGGAISDKLNSFLVEGEDWRLSSVDSFATRFNGKENEQRMAELCAKSKEKLQANDLHDLAVTALEVRAELSMTPYTKDWNQFQWHCNVFERQALVS